LVQYADYADLLTNLPTIAEVLDDQASELGRDFIPYRKHVYRVVNPSLAIVGDSRVELEKIAVATVRDLDEQDVRLHRSISRNGARGMAD
jgi:hypothetical protein